MANRFVSDIDGGIMRFERDKRFQAFGAAELISEHISPTPSVVNWVDEESGREYLAVRLNAQGRNVYDEENAKAAELCAIAQKS